MIYIKVVDKNGKEFISGYSEHEEFIFRDGVKGDTYVGGEDTLTINTQMEILERKSLRGKIKDLYSSWKEKRETKT